MNDAYNKWFENSKCSQCEDEGCSSRVVYSKHELLCKCITIFQILHTVIMGNEKK